MVVNERTAGCVDVVVWGGVSGCRGEGGDEGHLRGGVGLEERKGRGRERCKCGMGPASDRGQGGTTLVEFTYQKLLSKS